PRRGARPATAWRAGCLVATTLLVPTACGESPSLDDGEGGDAAGDAPGSGGAGGGAGGAPAGGTGSGAGEGGASTAGAAGGPGAGVGGGGGVPSEPSATMKIKDLTGPGTSAESFGVGGTDLGIPVRQPDGRIAYIF